MVAAAKPTETIETLAGEIREAVANVKKAEAAEASAMGAAAQRRLHLGNLLIRARKNWPERGPNAKGWGDFLDGVGLEQSTAWNYMKLAGYVAVVSPPDGEIPTYRDVGIDKRPRVANDEQPQLDAPVITLRAGRSTRWDDDMLTLKMQAQSISKAMDLLRAAKAEPNIARSNEMLVAALEEQRLNTKMGHDMLGAHHADHVQPFAQGGTGKRNGIANRQGGQRRYSEHAQAGKCVKCHDPALPGHARCQKHRLEMLTQKQREKAGL